MRRRVILGVIWVTFVAYTLWLAPLDQPYTWAIARCLLTGHWGEVNAYLMAILGLMGVWPMIYACLMFADGRMQPFRVWPYFIGANFTGVIGLLPYLLIRRRSEVFTGALDPVLAALDRRSTGVLLLGTAIALIFYALQSNEWNDYVQLFQTRAFVHLISLDFCLMALVFPITDLLIDDQARRHLKPSIWQWIAWVPLAGALLYLCGRPSLPTSDSSSLAASAKLA